MTRNYTPSQPAHYGPHPPTLTVGEIRAMLAPFDDDMPVIFRSPADGEFGPLVTFALGRIEQVQIKRESAPRPRPFTFDPWSEGPVWDGVIIDADFRP